MTAREVAVHLRIIEPHLEGEDAARGCKAVHHLVRKRGLRPIAGLKEYVFAETEVDRWLEEQTAAFVSNTKVLRFCSAAMRWGVSMGAPRMRRLSPPNATCSTWRR
jgi:hypothetical protein